MIRLRLICVAVLLAAVVRGKDGGRTRFVVEYFERKGVAAVTSGLCSEENNFRLHKEFSKRKIGFDILDLARASDADAVGRLTSRFHRLGALLDLACPRTMDFLNVANQKNLFTFSNSLTVWLLFTRSHITKENLEALAETYRPNVTDPIDFLTQSYEDGKNEKYLVEINKRVNHEFIEIRERFPRAEQIKSAVPANKSEILNILRMELLPDNEVALAVPGALRKDDPFVLYGVHKATAESRSTITELGRVRKEGRLKLKRWRRANLGGAILKAASVILQPDAFTTLDDLATRETDVWPKMSYPHVRLLAEDLNFRIMIRFFDDYGWQRNGTFGHLMGFLQQKKADLSAAALLMRTDRLHVIDFLECPFRLQTGILFREPSLSSVENIFLLPFSRAIWTSVGVAVVLTMVVLMCRIIAGKTCVPPDENVSDSSDIVSYIAGAIFQQGFSTTPKSPSARTSVLVILLTSLALFTSYSACIVAFLQSSSSSISTIADITRSNMEVGIQSNFPLYKVLIQEASDRTMKEFYERKVLPKGEKAFCDRREGIRRMRTGMFAFEVELTAGYKLIKETYEEREKCGIREVDVIPKPFICIAVRKPSPYKEIFTERLLRQREAGLFDRSWKLWADQKPNCEVGRIGFASVGLTESGAALRAFACGVLAAALILFVELLYKNNSHIIYSNAFLRNLIRGSHRRFPRHPGTQLP